MKPGQAWVFLEVGLGVVFVITMFCLCRYFDTKKVRRQRKRANTADENCYQEQLAAQRERAMSIRKESLMRDECETKQPLTDTLKEENEENEKEDSKEKESKEKEKESTEKESKEKKSEKEKEGSNSPAVSTKKEPPASPKPAEKQ